MTSSHSRARAACPLAVLLTAILLVAAGPSRSDAPAVARPAQADWRVRLQRRTYDLAKPADLAAFAHDLDGLYTVAEEQHKAKKSGDEDDADAAPVAGRRRDMSSKETRHALKYVREAAKDLLAGRGDRAATVRAVQEVAWAFESKWMTPWTWEPSLDLLDVPFHSRSLLLRGIGRGSRRNPAADLRTYDAPDLSKVDPLPSPFWRRPDAIPDLDLYVGFGRKRLPAIAGAVVSFGRVHKGYGVHPNFEADWHGDPWKVKFGEQNTEPFATRIFWALGFPVYPTDWAPAIRVQYDRRLLTSLFKGKANAMPLKFARITIARIGGRPANRPFPLIRYAVLRDGMRIDGAELKRRVFATGAARTGKSKFGGFDEAFEKTIDYLEMTDANIRSKKVDGQETLGFWDYDAYDHPKLRALRGMGLLQVWIENWDTRWGNNELRLVEDGDGKQRIEEAVSDLGTAFGEASGMIRSVNRRLRIGMIPEMIDAYPWTCTRALRAGQTSVPIRWYMPMAQIGPFYEMNIDDARWMARLIALLTENQLRQALIASGYEAPQARLLLEKLISRRDHMVQDLDLAGEIPLLKPAGANPSLNYDPRTDGPFEAALPSGAKVTARDTGRWVIQGGKLRDRNAPATRGTPH